MCSCSIPQFCYALLMSSTIQTEAAADLKETLVSISKTERELGMLRKAHSHLSGIPARQNAKRILDQEEMLSTYLHLKSAQERLSTHDGF